MSSTKVKSRSKPLGASSQDMACSHMQLDTQRRRASTLAKTGYGKEVVPPSIPPKSFLQYAPRVRLPSNSFGATQYKVNGERSPWRGAKLDRRRSGKAVDRLLGLRRQLMKEARQRGDDAEVHRLQHLGLFDNVYGDAKPNGCQLVGDVPVPEIDDVSWTTRVDSISDSKPSISSVSSEPSETSAIRQKKTDCDSDPDPWLEIAIEASPHVGDKLDRRRQRKDFRRPCDFPFCPGNRACGRHLRGGKGCCTPQAQPSIIAAKQRIAFFEQSPVAQQWQRDQELMPDQRAGLYAPGSPEIEAVKLRVDITLESAVSQQLEMDRELVRMYEQEMENRCAEGVWWEGWRIVEDLRCRGTIGSVHAM